MNLLQRISDLIRVDFIDFMATDWSLVKFKQGNFVFWAAIIMFAALLLRISLRLLRGRIEGSYYQHSGYAFDRKNKPGAFYFILRSISLVFVFCGTCFLFIAIADPYINLVSKTEFVESREIFYLRDVSPSMGWRFRNWNRSRAEIVQEFLLKLIASRRGSGDRSAYMVYMREPRLVIDFTTDFESLIFSVANGPQVIADPDSPKLYPGIFIIKDFTAEPFGGGSDLARGLEAVVKLFDQRGDKKISEVIGGSTSIRRRSVVIITDGASDYDPEAQFKELKKKNIVPYLIFIDPDKAMERMLGDENKAKLPEQLLRQIKAYGGDYAMATDLDALSRVGQRLNLLHASILGVKIHAAEEHIYRRPLGVALACLLLAALARLVFYGFYRTV
ncbi:MAG: vWA domain-containing protein [Patescibacteria group bacterium]